MWKNQQMQNSKKCIERNEALLSMFEIYVAEEWYSRNRNTFIIDKSKKGTRAEQEVANKARCYGDKKIVVGMFSTQLGLSREYIFISIANAMRGEKPLKLRQ